MTRPRVVIVDTNVIVAGLVTGDPGAPTAHVLDAMLAGSVRFALSVELLAEYRDVLLRPQIRRRHGLSGEEIDALVSELARNAVVVSPAPSDVRAPEPGDQHLWDLAYALRGAILVTGDSALREDAGVATLSAGELWEIALRRGR